jgi:hypothetical protein
MDMGRPIEVTNEEIIRAGNALVADNRAVNETRLFRGVGKRGRPARLMAVWTQHVEASTTVLQERSSPVAVLPETASRLLSDCKGNLAAGLDECVREIYATVERTLANRFSAEMAAMTTSRELHQAELHEAWQTLEELAEKNDAALLQAQDCERDVLVAHATLESERGVLSRAEIDKVALSARIDGLAAELEATSAVARAAETGRTRAKTLAEAMRAELDATQAALEAMRAANLDLEREVSGARRTCQLHEAWLDRQAGELRDLHADSADARQTHLEQATRAAGAEQALNALDRIMAGKEGDRKPSPNPERTHRRLTSVSNSDVTRPPSGPGAVDDDHTPSFAS